MRSICYIVLDGVELNCFFDSSGIAHYDALTDYLIDWLRIKTLRQFIFGENQIIANFIVDQMYSMHKTLIHSFCEKFKKKFKKIHSHQITTSR